MEVAKMICSYLHLEAVLGLAEGTHHDAGVVDQDVHLLHALLEPLHAGGDARQARQVHLLHAHISLGLVPAQKR